LSPARSLRLSPSPALAGLVVAAHLCAAAAAALALPGWAGGVLAAALAALGLASAWSRALLRSPRSVRCITLEAGKASVELADGESFPAEAGGHVSRLMVTLALRDPARRALLVSADMLDADSFRALRVWALWGKLPVAGKQVVPKQLAA
jgi:membrane-bound toxin of toxin-antitoxin system